MALDSPSDPTPDKEIERLAEELGRLIKSVGPERREDLKDLAFALIREEAIQEDREERREGSSPGPFNPLGTGVLIFVLGGGLSFIFGPVGLMLMLGGLIFIVWGAMISWMKKRG